MTTIAHGNGKPQKVESKTGAMRKAREAQALPAVETGAVPEGRGNVVPEAPGSKTAGKKNKVKRNMPHVSAVALSRTAKRIRTRRDAVAKWNREGAQVGLVLSLLDEGLKQIDTAIETLQEFPEGWSHKVKGGGAASESRRLQGGTLVAIREKFRPEYDLILEAAEMDDLRVVQHNGTRVVCSLPSGGRPVMIERKKLEIRESA